MAEMIIKYKILPDDSEVDSNTLLESIKTDIMKFNDSISINETEEVDLGFGLKGFLITLQLDENLGSEELKELLESNSLIGEVRVEFMDRL